MCIMYSQGKFAAVLMFVVQLGCVQTRYRNDVDPLQISSASDQTWIPGNSASHSIAYGGDYPRLDRIERTIRAPIDFVKKHVPYTKNIVSEESTRESRREGVALAERYIQDNRMSDVHIDVRRYEPREQWQRLKANNRMSPVVKYTGGTLSVLKYTLIPGRLFHSDEFNPYTSTLSLNSSNPIEAIYEAGNVKIHNQKKWRGAYAVAQYIPFASVGHKSQVASDVIAYANANGMQRVEKGLYPHTYADIAKTSVAQVFTLFPVGKGMTQFVVPLAGEFVAEKGGEFVGKSIAEDIGRDEWEQNQAKSLPHSPTTGGFLPFY